MGPQLPKPAAWQGLPNVSTSLMRSLPGHTWGPEGSWRQRQVAQIQVTSGASASTAGLVLVPRQNFSERLSPHSTPPPSFGMRGIHPGGHCKPGAAAGQVGSFPISPSKSISIPLCCHSLSPCSSQGSAGLCRTGRSPAWGGVSARGALLRLFLGPAALPSQPSSLGWRGKAQE